MKRLPPNPEHDCAVLGCRDVNLTREERTYLRRLLEESRTQADPIEIHLIEKLWL